MTGVEDPLGIGEASRLLLSDAWRLLSSDDEESRSSTLDIESVRTSSAWGVCADRASPV
jgi:hypothetical protein